MVQILSGVTSIDEFLNNLHTKTKTICNILENIYLFWFYEYSTQHLFFYIFENRSFSVLEQSNCYQKAKKSSVHSDTQLVRDIVVYFCTQRDTLLFMYELTYLNYKYSHHCILFVTDLFQVLMSFIK